MFKKTLPAFLVILLILITGVASYYVFQRATTLKRPVIETEKLSFLDNYLFKNFYFTLNLEPALEAPLRIYCDPTVATTTSKTSKIGYPCQNQSPAHKIVIGWASAEQKYMTTMKAVGNQQLFWRNYPSNKLEDGQLSCTEKPEYATSPGSTFGMSCVMVLSSGEKLYSSVVFIQPENVKKRRFFIVVMNTSISTSPETVEKELMTLVKKQRVLEKKVSSEINLITRAEASGGGGGGGAGDASCSAAAAAAAAPGAACGTSASDGNGGGVDVTVCDITDPSACYPLYCNSPTAVWDYNLSMCVEPPAPTLIYLIGTSCTIPSESNDCNTRAQWQINNAIDPRVYLNGNLAWAWGGATGDYYHNFSVLGPGTHTFSAWDGGAGGTLQTVVVTKTCAPGTVWNNTICVPPPTVSLSANSLNLTWNTATNLTWSSTNATGCTATGGWGGSKTTSGSQSTGNLTSTQTFNIYCTNVAGNSPTASRTVTVGTFAVPTWTGSSFVTPTGTITNNSCTIATGASSCSMNVAWSTTNPPGAVEVRRPYAGNSVMATGASGNGSYVFPYQASAYTLDLYDAHRNVKLDDGLFTATCALGGWDSIGGVCANPLVTNVTVTGQYYSTPGTLSFTCSGSNNYTVRNTDLGTTVASGVYSGATSVGVTPSANYSVTCSHGNYSSNPTVRYYNAPPPPPAIVSIVASPRTISKDAKTTLTWDVQWPPISPAVCTISAKSICTNGICNAAQLASEVALNNKLNTENTDTTDTSGSRRITTAVTTVAPGHIDTDWKALGKKTFSIPNTTEFTIDCGNGRKASTRVQVTTSNEQ